MDILQGLLIVVAASFFASSADAVEDFQRTERVAAVAVASFGSWAADPGEEENAACIDCIVPPPPLLRQMLRSWTVASHKTAAVHEPTWRAAWRMPVWLFPIWFFALEVMDW